MNTVASKTRPKKHTLTITFTENAEDQECYRLLSESAERASRRPLAWHGKYLLQIACGVVRTSLGQTGLRQWGIAVSVPPLDIKRVLEQGMKHYDDAPDRTPRVAKILRLVPPSPSEQNEPTESEVTP